MMIKQNKGAEGTRESSSAAVLEAAVAEACRMGRCKSVYRPYFGSLNQAMHVARHS
jgi:hypothetical protein